MVYSENFGWVLEAEPDVLMRLKRIFPRLNPSRTGTASITDTPEVARDLEWAMQRWPLAMNSDVAARLAARAEEDRRNERQLRAILGGYVEQTEGLVPQLEPYDYQWAPAEIVFTTGALLLVDELGLGKTLEGLLVLRRPEALPAMVVVPTHLVRQWVSDIHEVFPSLRVHVCRTARAYDPSSSREMKGHQPDVLICTYTKLHGWADHLAGHIKTVIFDEIQDLRHNATRKYEAAERIAEGALFAMGMTATPVYNYGGEAYNIVSLLSPDVLGSRAEFIREWGVGENGTKTAVEDPAQLGRYLRERGVFLRRTRKEVGRFLPPMRRVPHLIDADQAVLDDLMEGTVDLAELILDRGDHSVEEVWRASSSLDWRVRQATGLAKAPYVAAFVKMLLESEDKIIVWVWHREVYGVLLEALAEFNPVLYSGSESPAQKYANASRFIGGKRLDDLRLKQQRGLNYATESRVMLMSLRSGTGLNGLQHVCHTGVFAELDWSPGMHDQCIGRLDRVGQDTPVMAYFLWTNDGSDPVVMEALNIKRMQSEPIKDPDTPVVENIAADPERIKKLAADVIERRGKGNTTSVRVLAHRKGKPDLRVVK